MKQQSAAPSAEAEAQLKSAVADSHHSKLKPSAVAAKPVAEPLELASDPIKTLAEPLELASEAPQRRRSRRMAVLEAEVEKSKQPYDLSQPHAHNQARAAKAANAAVELAALKDAEASEATAEPSELVLEPIKTVAEPSELGSEPIKPSASSDLSELKTAASSEVNPAVGVKTVGEDSPSVEQEVGDG